MSDYPGHFMMLNANQSPPSSPQNHDSLAREKLIAAHGEMADRVRGHDWTGTPLGPIERWSKELLATVNLVLFSPIPACVYWGPQLTMIYNDRYAYFLGEKHPGSLGQTAGEVWKEAWAIIGPQINAAMAEGRPTFEQNVLIPICKGGQMQEFYWDYGFVPVFEDGQIAGIFNTAHDTTEAYLATRDRDSIARQLEQVMAATTDGVAYLDRQWRITYLNERARQIIAPRGDVLGTDHWESYPETVFEGSPYVEHYYRAMDEKVAGRFEAFYPAPLNVWFQASVQPAEDGIVIFFRDVTEQKQKEDAIRQTAEALSASEEELRWTLELSAQIAWTADPDGKVLHYSERWEALTGQPSSHALGDNWTAVQHPEDVATLTESWRNSVMTGDPFDAEHRVRTASGEYCWMRSRAYPRRDQAGAICKWYGTTEDIHERKLAELALLQSEKLAAVGRLASSIAHEINNPLESVTNLLYLARSTDSQPEEKDQFLEAAERELRRVAIITNQTLRFHRQATSPTGVFCQDLIGGSLSVYQGRLVNSRIVVEKRKRATMPVHCFEGEIRQVLNNLIGNAIDAMHATGGRLLIRSREATQWTTGLKGLVLTVADTGSGMSPEVQRKVFEPFFTTKGFGGTGLGLWVSREIMERHNGKLSVRSRQSEGASGTVFSLFLPFDAVAR